MLRIRGHHFIYEDLRRRYYSHDPPTSDHTMAPARDTSAQTDITKFKVEADGSFKRPDSTFRSSIKPGSDFEPEAGAYYRWVIVDA